MYLPIYFSVSVVPLKAENKPSFSSLLGEVIAIKPERFLDPNVERRLVGGMSLTLSVGHVMEIVGVLVVCRDAML